MSGTNIEHAGNFGAQEYRLVMRQEQAQHAGPFQRRCVAAQIIGHAGREYPQFPIPPVFRVTRHVKGPCKLPVFNQPQHLVFIPVNQAHDAAHRQKRLAALPGNGGGCGGKCSATVHGKEGLAAASIGMPAGTAGALR